MNKKANTAVICLSPYYGGMEMVSIRLAKLLSKSTNVLFIVKRDAFIDLNYSPHAERDGVTLKTINFSFNFSFSILFGVKKLVEEYNIKNVIYLGASELRSLYFAFRGKDINLIIRHATTKSHPKKDFFHRLIYKDVNWHVAISRHIANNVKYIIPFGKKARLKVIYPSLRCYPDEIPEPQSKQPGEITLLHVSRLTEGKGTIDAIEACNILYKNDIPFKLLCVGKIEESFTGKLDSALKDKPYRSQIEFPGFTDNVCEYYKKADIFLFPSRGEGFGNSFAEALSFGLICIAYANTTIPEFQQIGFELLMANNLDVDDFSNKLMQAANILKSQKTPNINNIKLAKSMLANEKELAEYFEIMV